MPHDVHPLASGHHPSDARTTLREASMSLVKASTQLAGVADLALIASVKPGVVPGAEGFTYARRLELLLRTVGAIRRASREVPLFDSPLPDSVGRFGLLHAFRYALVPPDIGSQGEAPHPPGEMHPGVYRLFLSVTFDGGWEPYLRVIYRDLGPLLDTIFSNCTGYRASSTHSFDSYIRWVRAQEAPAGIFYAESPMTVIDQRYLRQVERLQRDAADPWQARQAMAAYVEPSAGDVQTALRRLAEARPEVQREVLTNNLRALKGLYDLRACFPDNAEHDDRTLLRFAQRAMPEFRALLASGRPVPPDNQASVDWLLRPSRQADYPDVDREPALAWPLASLQAGVLGAAATGATHGAVFLLGVTHAEAARDWLRTLPVTPGHREPLKRPRGLLRQLAFTIQGLQALGVLRSDADLARFPQEFIDGMEARAGLLGDVRGNHPERWQRPLHQGAEIELQSVHLVLQVRLADPSRPDHGLHPRLRRLQRQLSATPGLLLLATEVLRSWPEDPARQARGHFGFRDGLSQPVPRDAGARADPVWDDGVFPGEVLLGHRNDRGGGVYPAKPDPLLDNGSFLVLRKTAQHVEHWHQVVQAAGRRMDPLFDRRSDAQQRLQLGLVAAKLMGRSLNGEPTVDLGAGPTNRFNYDADPAGAACPFAAHARRSNPRLRETEGPDKDKPRVPRLLRRGMSYGPRWQAGADAAVEADRGLFFMAYCGSIAEQFEVVQRWLAGGNSTGVASSQSDPFLGVPQAGQPRSVQWLDAQGQVQRVDLGEQPLTTLRWGLYLFVPSLQGLRHIAAGPAADPAHDAQPLQGEAYAPGSPDFERWRQLLQDEQARGALWRRVNDSGGRVQTAHGELVSAPAVVLQVLRDEGRQFSVRGYGRRFAASTGPGYLGMDVVKPDGTSGGHDERAEDSGVNAAIVGIGEDRAYAAALQHTRERLQELAAGTPPAVPGDAQWVAVDVLDLGERVLARLCQDWFGVPDGVHLHVGSSAADAPPPRCPRDLVHVARYIFGAHPSADVSQQGMQRGQALQQAVLAYLRTHEATLPQPLPELSHAIHQGLHAQGLEVVAHTIAGVMLGFTPSVFGNYSLLMRAWIDRDGDPGAAHTLWDLQARLLQHGPAQAADYTTVRQQLRPALIAQMRRDPIPTTVWRECAGTPEPADPTGLQEPEKIVVGLHGAMQHPDAPDLLMWGGAWRGGDGPAELKTPHACPGYGLSTGVLMGLVAGLLTAGSLRASPSPTIVYWLR
jgi:Dyp-type peroxidase family